MIKQLSIDMLPQLMALQEAHYAEATSHFPDLRPFISMKATIEEQLKHLILQQYGVAWCVDGDVLAYMTGYSGIESMKGSQAGAYTPEIGHGLKAGQSINLYHDLMQALWANWLPMGVKTHGLSYLAHQTAVRDFCFDMAYGKIVEDGILALNQADKALGSKGNLSTQEPLRIRRAEKDDLEVLWRWEVGLIKALNENPIFRYGEIPSLEEVTQRYKGAFIGRDVLTLVAEGPKGVLGAIRGHYGDSTNSVWAIHKDNFAIDYLWVEPDTRKQKVAQALLGALKGEALSCGMTTLSVDYETHNMKAKAFWRKHFTVFSESVLRKIDDRID